MERWLPIAGFEGLYEVSDLGRVRACRRIVKQKRRDGTIVDRPLQERILVPHPNKKGYLHVSLSKDGRRYTCKLHKLVMQAFVGRCPEGLEVCHGDSAKPNNALTNLRYDTRASNVADRIARQRVSRGS